MKSLVKSFKGKEHISLILKRNINDDLYLCMTESKKINSESEHHKVFCFRSTYYGFFKHI